MLGLLHRCCCHFANQTSFFYLYSCAGNSCVAGVSHSLHSPLMAMTNAISGMTVVGGMLQLGGGFLPGTVPQVLAAAAGTTHALIHPSSPTRLQMNIRVDGSSVWYSDEARYLEGALNLEADDNDLIDPDPACNVKDGCQLSSPRPRRQRKHSLNVPLPPFPHFRHHNLYIDKNHLHYSFACSWSFGSESHRWHDCNEEDA